MQKNLIAIALLAAAGAANATASLNGGTEVHFTGNASANVAIDAQDSGLLNAEVVSNDALDRVTVTFLGKDAGHLNQLFVDGNLVLDSLAPTASVRGPFQGGNGALNFSFKDTNDNASVPNGGNPLVYASYVVFGSFDQAGAFSAYTKGGEFDYVLGFNDNWHFDKDYNDMVIGINVSPVPEADTYALMLAGLGVMGFVAKRRKAS